MKYNSYMMISTLGFDGAKISYISYSKAPAKYMIVIGSRDA